jgi:hypothetical protein
LVAYLLVTLRKIGADKLQQEAVAGFVANGETFDPGTVIVPALKLLHERRQLAFATDAEAQRLWVPQGTAKHLVLVRRSRARKQTSRRPSRSVPRPLRSEGRQTVDPCFQPVTIQGLLRRTGTKATCVAS